MNLSEKLARAIWCNYKMLDTMNFGITSQEEIQYRTYSMQTILDRCKELTADNVYDEFMKYHIADWSSVDAVLPKESQLSILHTIREVLNENT
jgi:hypothetical protein